MLEPAAASARCFAAISLRTEAGTAGRADMDVILGTDRNHGKALRREEPSATNGGTNPASHHTLPVKVKNWVGFATMCIGMFMAILDVQVVATSLPTIQHALNIAQDQSPRIR
jgi:hypothetical protein